MSTPAVRDHQSPLETALLDVHATLGELLVAADEQYTAVADRDRERLESVTRRQEQLSVRLERAERQRINALNGASLRSIITSLPANRGRRVLAVQVAIARSVRELQQRNARAASLLERSIELTSQTLQFLHRLASPEVPTYGSRSLASARRSVLVDGRA
jgi:flagellar biosynthesis/type III secretory pathway chaperone